MTAAALTDAHDAAAGAPSPPHVGTHVTAADLRRSLLSEVSDRLVRAAGGTPQEPGVPARQGETTCRGADRPVTLADVVAAAGEQVVRYELLRHPRRSRVTLDVTELRRAAVRNPHYLVCYAHARSVALLRNAADLGVPMTGDPGTDVLAPDAAPLARLLTALPDVVATAATREEPHRLTRHLEATAEAFLAWLATSRVLPRGDEEPADQHWSAALLVAATGRALRDGLHLLGLPAPERM